MSPGAAQHDEKTRRNHGTEPQNPKESVEGSHRSTNVARPPVISKKDGKFIFDYLRKKAIHSPQ